MSAARAIARVAPAMVFLTVGLPIVAQVMPDTHGVPSRLNTPPDMQRMASDDAMIAFADMTRCVVLRNPQAERNLLAAQSGAPGENELTRTLLGRTAESSCLAQAGQLKLSHAVLRGGVAEALLRFDNKTGRIKLPSALGPRPLRPTTDINIVISFGDCVIVAEPTLASGLVLETHPGRADELQTINQLKPAMGSCLPAKQDFRLSRAMIRYSIAEALYART